MIDRLPDPLPLFGLKAARYPDTSTTGKEACRRQASARPKSASSQGELNARQSASIRPFSIQTLCIAMSLKTKDFAPNGCVGLDISKAAIDVCLLCDSGRLHTKTA